MEVLQSVWRFIQDQIFGMKWLHGAIDSGLSALGLDVSSRWGGSVLFFLYDVVKITVLLCVLIFVISYIQSFFPPERSRRILGRFRGIWANLIAALLGTVTPLLLLLIHSAVYRLHQRGSASGRGAVLYDGDYHTLTAFHDHAPKGGKAEAAGNLHCDLHYGNHYCGLFV